MFAMDMKPCSGRSNAPSRPLRALVAAVVLTIGWAGGTCGASSSSPEIRAGSELDFRPYAYTDKNGQPTGFGVELLKAVADKMGLRIRITAEPWDRAWDGLVAGKLDVLPVVARTPGREQFVDFTLPHTETFDAFFVREGRPELPDLAAAAGKEIVVLRSDVAHHELVGRKFSGKVIPVDSIPDGLRLLEAGKHDAMLCSKLVGVLERQQAGVKGVQPGPPIPDYKRVFSFAVRKGDAELLEKLNQGLSIVKATGEYDQIYRRWLVAEEPWRELVPYLKLALGGLVLLAGLVVALQWLVRRRTRELAEELAERRKAETALHQLNATLELRVAERTGELRESEARLALTASGTRIGIFDRNLKTGEITATEQNTRLLGMELPAATTTTATTTLSRRYGYRDWAERVHPEDLPRVKAEMDRCTSEHAPFETEYRVVWPDGSVHWLAARGLLQYDDQGAATRLLGILMDITNRKQAERQLKLNLDAMTRLQMLGTLFVREGNLKPVLSEIVDAAIAITGADFGNIQLLDPATGDLRIVAQRAFPQWWLDYWNAVARGKGACGKALERGERVIVENVEESPIFVGSPALDIQLQAGVHAVQSTPLISRSGKPLGMFSTHYKAQYRPDEHTLRSLDLLARQAADIIERARIEAILRESEERLRLAQTAARVGIWDRDLRTGVLSWTPELEEIYGLEGGSARTYEDFRRRVHPDDVAVAEAMLDEAVAQHRGFEIEFRIFQPDGNVLWVQGRGAATYDETGTAVRVFGVNIDITDRKRMDEALKASLADKDVLLRELAHRTKNNMQVIASLLGLQASASADEKFAAAVADAQDRIRAMAFVHENLYRSGNFASLNLKAYLEDLLTSLLRSHHVAERSIKMNLDMEDVFISIDMALPCGLIISELVANSLKHAFRERNAGAIFLSLRLAGELVELKYRDDGPGLPKGMELSRIKSLGLKLVHNLAVRQLRGTMDIRRNPLTEFAFTFRDTDVLKKL